MDNFREELMKVLEANLGANYEVKVAETVKNNELKLTGVTICEKNSNIAPIFYLEGYHDDYVKGILNLEDIPVGTCFRGRRCWVSMDYKVPKA